MEWFANQLSCRYAPDVNHVPDDFTADFLARRESYSDVRRCH